jgi:hypothetical protein
MRMRSSAVLAAAGLFLSACAGTSSRVADAPRAEPVPAHPAEATSGPLYAEIAALDDAVFDAFNRCSDPAQFERHAAYITPELEFYHDKGGVTLGREKYMSDVRENVCGRFARRLVKETLQVYPVPGYGAMETGVHRFCAFESARCEGAGDFLVLWRKDADGWRMTRVFSYAHRAD